LHRGRPITGRVRARLGVREIDQPVLCEARMERDVEQTAKASREHLGQRSDRRRVEHAVLDLTQSSWALCDKHAAIREEGDAPRMIESLGDDRDVNTRASAGGKMPRPGGTRINRSGTASASLPLSSRGP